MWRHRRRVFVFLKRHLRNAIGHQRALAAAVPLVQKESAPAANEEQAENDGDQNKQPEPSHVPGHRERS